MDKPEKTIYREGRDIIFELVSGNPEYANAYHYHAPYVGFGLLLRDGLITKAEYDLARKQAGRMWNYCGD